MKESMASDSIKFVSIYWLYLSIYFMKELPLSIFETFNETRMREEKRLRDFISKIL
jgi:hypothetical protein